MNQKLFINVFAHDALKTILDEITSEKFLLVCDSSFEYLSIKEFFDALDTPYIKFDKFTPNPVYEDVFDGVELFNSEKCDAIIAVGGGSTIDVAKCIKLFCRMNKDRNFLEQEYRDSDVPLIATPTTAGTGSESTRFAVIYYDGKKQSITHDSILPDYAVIDHRFLKTLPTYQKKCTMLDALCQGIESWWSVNSTDESKAYSKTAIELITKYWNVYINDGLEEAAEKIMLASNFAGRAINITQTTAAHAMSYKLTSMYKLPHGHAVAVCLPEVWQYMVINLDKCIDQRGIGYLSDTFDEIAYAFGSNSPKEAIINFKNMIEELDIRYPVSDKKHEDVDALVKSVNLVRLANNPVSLDEKALSYMYERIVQDET